MSRAARAAILLAVALLLVAPPLHGWLEAGMARQMLLQSPAWFLLGLQAIVVLPARARAVVQSAHAHGLAGASLASLVLLLWMVPRAIDAALRDPWLDAARLASLALAGAASGLAWPLAGAALRLFFIGNAAWMAATVGLLYQSMPQRLCNAYLLDDQVHAGQGLVAWALAGALLALRELLRAGTAADRVARSAPDPNPVEPTP